MTGPPAKFLHSFHPFFFFDLRAISRDITGYHRRITTEAFWDVLWLKLFWVLSALKKIQRRYHGISQDITGVLRLRLFETYYDWNSFECFQRRYHGISQDITGVLRLRLFETYYDWNSFECFQRRYHRISQDITGVLRLKLFWVLSTKISRDITGVLWLKLFWVLSTKISMEPLSKEPPSHASDAYRDSYEGVLMRFRNPRWRCREHRGRCPRCRRFLRRSR